METNEKLDVFYRAAIDAAKEQSAAILQEYEEAYQRELGEYERGKKEEAAGRERARQERVRKEVNRAAAEELTRLRQERSRRQQEKKEELFALAEKKVGEYRKTDAYRGLLLEQIAYAISFAGGEEAEIIIDPGDRAMEAELSKKAGHPLAVAERGFGGGIMARIPGKNVMLDLSFSTRMQREREAFSFGAR